MGKIVYYSAAEAGFFDPVLIAELPKDAVLVKWSTYQQLICSGKCIVANDEGQPVVSTLQSVEDQSVTERAWRDTQLSAVTWLRDRHRDQIDIATETTLTSEQFTELLVYMQALRDWPQSQVFPAFELRPVAPPWVAQQNQ